MGEWILRIEGTPGTQRVTAATREEAMAQHVNAVDAVPAILSASDVLVMREVFSLALEQSEARVEDARDVDDETYAQAVRDHNRVVDFMVRLDGLFS